MAAAKRMLEQNLKIIDIVLLLLDARVPASGKNPDLDRLVAGKQQLVVLNKADLADPVQTAKWLAEYKSRGIAAMETSLTKNKRAELLAIWTGWPRRRANALRAGHEQNGARAGVRNSQGGEVYAQQSCLRSEQNQGETAE